MARLYWRDGLRKLEKEELKEKETESELEEAERIRGRGQTLNRNDIPKIQKVQPYLRNRPGFAKYYSPQLISMGPIHSCLRHDERLQEGDRYKMIWASMYLKDTNQSSQSLFEKIQAQLRPLIELYAEELIYEFDDSYDQIAWMFLLDGCALLEFLRNHRVDIAFPEAKLKIKGDQLDLVRQDLLLLENQLPYQLLTLLSNVPENELNQWIESFLKTHPMTKSTIAVTSSSKGPEEVKITVEVDQPPHLLHLLRQSILGYSENKSNKDGGGGGWGYRNIQELKAGGIQVKRSDSNCPIHITFSAGWLSGELRLPTIHMDLTTPSTYLNLMAYEVCPDFANNFEITSYVQFLTSMIKYPDDVKELRSRGCMINFYGSDVEIANFFNFISAESVLNATMFDPVRHDIERYFISVYRAWLAQAYHAYFSNSGSFIAFIAASVALVLTFIQTWFAVRCSK